MSPSGLGATHVERPPAPAMADVRAFVAERLRAVASAGAPEQPIALITVPAPRAPVDALLGDEPCAILWDPPSGTRFAGVGCAVEITGSGAHRAADIAERARPIWQRLVQSTFPGVEPVTARFFGGFSFAPGAASQTPWQDFGDARFVLPAWLYAVDDLGARLSLCAPAALSGQGPRPRLAGADLDRWVARCLGELEDLVARLDSWQPGADRAGREEPPDAPGRAEVVSSVELTEPAVWRRQVTDIRRAIAEARCDKIVAARCRVLELGAPIDTARVLGRLDQRFPDCHRFAFRFASAVFVGATPERLIARTGDRISTQALAGSIAAGPASGRQAAASALLESLKDRREQDFVVQTIRAVLEPLCSHLEVAEQPVIRELRDVLHLETPISGVLRQPVHILELLHELHPTPAVGGVPTPLALSWIDENEPTPRGWYAAPVGCFDAHGQGEFAVAIRSGVVHGKQAYIYVGAGIVHDSDPDNELAETRLKQRALLGALGLDS